MTRPPCLPLSLFLLTNFAMAALPRVDFDRMGKVGLAGSFAGFDLFQNATSALSFDPATATLLSRAADGSLTRIGATNVGGRITAGCSLGDTFYLAGSFSSIEGVTASNVASYNPSTGSFAALASGGPNGEVDALFCDAKESRVWAGGAFTSPGSSVAVWDPSASSWSPPPFAGLSGAGARVRSITTNSSQSSLFLGGSFLTSFQNGSTFLNFTGNPNVTASIGATPFSHSLVPVPIRPDQIQGSPSSSDPQFADVTKILCPAGPDGPGNSWHGADGIEAVVTIRTFTFTSASGIRMGNTFQSNHGTTAFSVTTIPDNAVRKLTYVDPTTRQNRTCTESCPLLTDSSIPYQDFMFDDPLAITGVLIKLSEFTGSGPGLHIVQILSSGALASSQDDQNIPSCFAPNPSNTTRTGNWAVKQANTGIPGTVQSVVVSEVNVGTAGANGPTFSWLPYVSAGGDYDINMLVPGCANFLDCDERTSVKVTVFPGGGLNPSVKTISQRNQDDATLLIYSGPVFPSTTGSVATIEMRLADNPEGQGSGGKFELVADRIQLVLKSVNGSAAGSGNGAGVGGGRQGFGFYEWPISSSGPAVNASGLLPNTSQTALNAVGFGLFDGAGSSLTASPNSAVVSTVAHHSSGAIVVGGSFNLTAGPASGAANIAIFHNGGLSAVAERGVNGAVSSFVLSDDQLFVGGSFTDSSSGSSQGRMRNIAIYNVATNSWTSMRAGLNGPVTSLGLLNGQVQVMGNFTKIVSDSGGDGADAAGFAMWDINTRNWANPGGYLVGSMSFIANGTSSVQYIAGSVVASRRFGASGLVMLQNSDSDIPKITPLKIQLQDRSDASTSSSSSVSNPRRRHLHNRATAWFSHSSISQLFTRQESTTGPAALPAPPPAPAPAVLAGAFWTNDTARKDVTIVGGNFTVPSAPADAISQSLVAYDPDAGTVTPLKGQSLNGTVRALLVNDNALYVGGTFTLSGLVANGFALYDLAEGQWKVDGVQALQPASGGLVLVRSISQTEAKANTVFVAGSFASAGSLPCQAICSYDTQARQWNTLGSGIRGEVAAVAYAGDKQDILIASGSIVLSDGTAANVAQYHIANMTWAAVGDASSLPGPITAVEVNGGNTSSIFAAGRVSDGSATFMSFWNGVSWRQLDSTLQPNTTVSQLAMVPLQGDHDANGIIQSDRMLMVSGSLFDSSFGNVSSALYDGQSFLPYIVSTSASGASGAVAALFHSFSNFSFNRRKFLAKGVVILISIAIAAGVVFLIALIGILWTLFTRRDDNLQKFDNAAIEDDDESTQHRPSSLLEHINAATRTTILGGLAGGAVAAGKAGSDDDEQEKYPMQERTPGPDGAYAAKDQADPFGPDADESHYVRADTPSDAAGGLMPEESSRPAHARYSFDGTGEGELPMTAGTQLMVLDDRDPAWWYARDVKTGREGVVPAAYLY
ncbi:hypothetical protein HGRIS_002239 [Hohenbuehelia grisea]|uniref:SH3 domain-containing protein n=1 Tax=Hohenbuehelia grisea TaxID=104357 RepID=A0ABR3JKS5_9AGAR